MVDGQNLEVELSELASARAKVDHVSQEMQEGVAELERKVTDLLAGWKGVSGSAYEPAWNEWRSGASKVLAALDQSAQALDFVRQSYAEQEDANTASLRSSAAPLLNLDL